ncbi:MAG TPA: TetR/AcrR family transcriptional regulator [Rhodoblastus sp.]|nr:TetR/AcrR family transcriptional regulator [Rhodoblastus sp.]
MTASFTPKPPLKESESGALKARLIAAARDLLEREGLAALSLRAAARASGVSHMAPYRHFESKDDLLAAVAEQGFRDLTRALDDGAARPMADESQAMATGIAYVLFALSNPSLYRLMFGPQLQPCERFPGLIAAGAAAFACCIAAARAEGFDCPDRDDGAPPLVAAALWSMVHGLSSLALDGMIPLPDEASARRAVIAQILAVSLRPR